MGLTCSFATELCVSMKRANVYFLTDAIGRLIYVVGRVTLWGDVAASSTAQKYLSPPAI